MRKTQTDKTILVIGDSITRRRAPNYPTYTEKILNSAEGKTVKFVNLARPAMRTGRVLRFIEKALELHDPDVVLFMIGKSDSESGRLPRAKSGILVIRLFQTYFRSFRRNLINWYSSLQVFMLKLNLLGIESLNYRALNELFWSSHQNTKLCIKYGVSVVERYEKERQGVHVSALKKLYNCFAKNTASRQKGIEFLLKLHDRFPSDEVVKGHLSYIYLLSGKRELAERLMGESNINHKEGIKTRLVHNSRRAQNTRSMVNYFSAIAQSSNFPQNERTIFNLRKLYRILQRMGRTTVFLQYPTDNVENIRRVFAGLDGQNLFFFDSHSVFLESSARGTVDQYFLDDWEHMTPQGHEKLAKSLAVFIEKIL